MYAFYSGIILILIIEFFMKNPPEIRPVGIGNFVNTIKSWDYNEVSSIVYTNN